MLISRSLRNPFVVGHAFYWNLKSLLYMKPSYERFFVLLECFLMLAGQFVKEFVLQDKVNAILVGTQKAMFKQIKKKDRGWKDLKAITTEQ